jgi:hypothetical protein
MIGCEDGLTVVVAAAQQGPFRLAARGTDGTTREHECPPGQECGEIFLPGFLPEEVTLELTAGGTTSTRTVRPEVETLQPNGPGCPPTCRQARVSLPWPGEGTGGEAPGDDGTG